MAVVVVLRRAVVILPSGASKASRSASRRVADDPGVDRPPGLRRGHARATDRRLELAAGGQHGVADLLGVEPLDGSFPEQAVVGIDPLRRGEVALAAHGCLAIGRRGQDQPVQRLELPAAARRTPLASQSSSSGWLGRSPSRPKSLGVPTRPRPKWYCQTRLTITRVESGLSGRLSQRARASRRPVERGAAGGGSIRAGAGSSTERNPGSIGSCLRSPGIQRRRRDRPDVGRREHRLPAADRPQGDRTA